MIETFLPYFWPQPEALAEDSEEKRTSRAQGDAKGSEKACLDDDSDDFLRQRDQGYYWSMFHHW